MKFTLDGSGTVSQCREQLNGAIAELPIPHTESNAVVRAAAHYIVVENLDPLYAAWVKACSDNAEARTPREKGGLGRDPNTVIDPPEPETSFSISIDIPIEELARTS